MDSFATAICLALQYGVPLQTLVNKFIHSRFEPSGLQRTKRSRWRSPSWTTSSAAWPCVPAARRAARSRSRAIGQRARAALLRRSVRPDRERAAVRPRTATGTRASMGRANALCTAGELQEDAPPCSECGTIMIRAGACYRCDNCGATSGCG